MKEVKPVYLHNLSKKLKDDVLKRIYTFGGEFSSIMHYHQAAELTVPLYNTSLGLKRSTRGRDGSFGEGKKYWIHLTVGKYGLILKDNELPPHTLDCVMDRGVWRPCVRYRLAFDTSGLLTAEIPSYLVGEYLYVRDGAEVRFIYDQAKQVYRVECEKALCEAAGVKLGEKRVIHQYSEPLIQYLSAQEHADLGAVATVETSGSCYGLTSEVLEFRKNFSESLKTIHSSQ